MRSGALERSTKETSINGTLVVDGDGEAEVSTGIPFFDHMLAQLARHGGFHLTLDAKGMRDDYLAALAEFRDGYRVECSKVGVDYVPIDTSVTFDRALIEYLVQRQRRF